MVNKMISQNEKHKIVVENGLYKDVPPVAGFMPENLIQVIWRSRWIVLLTTVFCLILAVVYITKATPIYTSTSRIYVEQSGPKILTEEEGVMTQSKNYLYTQAELLKSTPILSDVLDEPGISQMRTFTRIDNPVGFLKKTLEVEVGRKDDIISLSFNSPYPTEAAQMVNSVVDSYITYHSSRKRSTSAEVLKIIQSEKNKRSKELAEKLKAMMDFRQENEALAYESRQGNIVIDRLERLSMVLTEAQLTTIEYKSVYESTKEMVSDPTKLMQFIEAQRATTTYLPVSSQKAELKSRLDQLELSLKNRMRQVAPGHPVIAAFQNDIDRVKAQIADLDAEFAKAQLAVAEQQYLAAKEKENQIAKYYEEQRKQAFELNEQIAQYTLLQSDWEQTKEFCDILDDRIKDLNITEDAGVLNISILEVARPAEAPSKPQKARYMALALVVGFMLGGGLALLRDLMDQKLHSAEEISMVLGVPVLGVVPSMSKRDNITERGRKVYLDSKSPWAEAYRTIRTAVFFGAPKGESKTMLVTSPAPSDGKTTLVSNLAIAMAQAGQRTLILDADFRKPMQHNIFGINHDHMGLSSVLAGTMTLKEAIQATEIKGLDILSRGPDVPNPSEILNSSSFSKVLKLLSNEYDRVIVDSPPVMPVTDALILAAICDITLLVLRAEKSTRKVSRQARDGLLSVGAHVLGAVVNGVRSKSRYGYYSTGGQYYDNDSQRNKKVSNKRTVAVV